MTQRRAGDDVLVAGGQPTVLDGQAARDFELEVGQVIEAAGGVAPDLPLIDIQDTSLVEISDEGLSALRASNDPPRLFWARRPVRLETHEGGPELRPLSKAALRGELARAAHWTKGAKVVYPPTDVCEDLLALPGWPDFPEIGGVVTCPTIGPDGAITLAPGYHPGARVWHHPTTESPIPPISEHPTASEIERARELLLEPLAEMPWVDEASQTHAVAAMLLPFGRRVIRGPAPMHLISAPQVGSGKTLLTDVIAIPTLGDAAPVTTYTDADDEMRKRITATLAGSPQIILLDNLPRGLDSPVLAAALTCQRWQDRVLGVSAMADYEVWCLWLATGNNPALSAEMARRCVLSRLDAGLERPWERRGWRHPDLRRWCREHRHELIWAALTLWRAWWAAGRPRWNGVALGSYEEWAAIMGGILEIAGLRGLLANREAVLQADDTLEPWRAMVRHWWSTYGQEPMPTHYLHQLCRELDLLTEVWAGADTEHAQKIKLGKALREMDGRVVGEYRIHVPDRDRSGRPLYALSRAGVSLTPAHSCAHSYSQKNGSTNGIGTAGEAMCRSAGVPTQVPRARVRAHAHARGEGPDTPATPAHLADPDTTGDCSPQECAGVACTPAQLDLVEVPL